MGVGGEEKGGAGDSEAERREGTVEGREEEGKTTLESSREKHLHVGACARPRELPQDVGWRRRSSVSMRANRHASLLQISAIRELVGSAEQALSRASSPLPQLRGLASASTILLRSLSA